MKTVTNETNSGILLAAKLSVRYGEKSAVLDGVTLDVRRGEVHGLIGQSGSGKSTLALAILGLLDRKRVTVEGSIDFEGGDLLQLRERELREIRGRKIALVLQSPLSSLNPALKIRTQLREAWRAHASGSRVECDRAVCVMMHEQAQSLRLEFRHREFAAQPNVRRSPFRNVNPACWSFRSQPVPLSKGRR